MRRQSEAMNLSGYLRYARNQLPAGPDGNPQLEAEVLIRHALNISREQYFATLNRKLSRDETRVLDALVARRASGEPLAYITGHREFYGLDLVVNEHVLIPRQETELLVDLVLEFAQTLPGDELSIADVGTGSGAIAVALAHSLIHATVFAVELEPNALSVAQTNASRHEVAERVYMLQGDLLEPVRRPVDIIVCNPPYIRTDAIAGLALEVQREPEQALDGGMDGLDVFRRLLVQAPAKLKGGGCLLVELSPEQMDEAKILAKRAFPGAEVSHADDLLGLARVLTVKTE